MDENEREVTMEELRAEALKRLDYFVTNYSLNPKAKTDFENGTVYCSYTTTEGLAGSIDNIKNNIRYADVVAEYEKNYRGIVYHAIESGIMLVLMYVSIYPESWISEISMGNLVDVYVFNSDIPDFSEFGSLRICAFGESGALAVKD